MKKHLSNRSTLVLVALAALTLTACSRDEERIATERNPGATMNMPTTGTYPSDSMGDSGYQTQDTARDTGRTAGASSSIGNTPQSSPGNTNAR